MINLSMRLLEENIKSIKISVLCTEWYANLRSLQVFGSSINVKFVFFIQLCWACALDFYFKTLAYCTFEFVSLQNRILYKILTPNKSYNVVAVSRKAFTNGEISFKPSNETLLDFCFKYCFYIQNTLSLFFLIIHYLAPHLLTPPESKSYIIWYLKSMYQTSLPQILDHPDVLHRLKIVQILHLVNCLSGV